MEWGALEEACGVVFRLSGLLPNRTNFTAPQGAPSLSLPAAGEVMEIDETDPSNRIPNASSLLEFPTKGRRFTSFSAPGMLIMWRR